jgi:hypothetical protein
MDGVSGEYMYQLATELFPSPGVSLVRVSGRHYTLSKENSPD